MKKATENFMIGPRKILKQHQGLNHNEACLVISWDWREQTRRKQRMYGWANAEKGKIVGTEK